MRVLNGQTVVFGVEPDSLLAAQLEAGDVVVSVDGRAALARGPAEVQDMLSGVRGTLVAVGVTRPGAGGAPPAPGAAARVVQLLRDIPLAQLGADTPRRAGTRDGGDGLHDRVPEMGFTTRGLHDTLHDTRHAAAAVGVPAGGRAAQGDAEAGRRGTPLQNAPRAAPLAASRPARTGGASGAPRQPGATQRADAPPAKGVGPRGEAAARAPADAPARRAGSAAPATAAARGRAAGGDGSGGSSGGGAAAWAPPESDAERGPRGHWSRPLGAAGGAEERQARGPRRARGGEVEAVPLLRACPADARLEAGTLREAEAAEAPERWAGAGEGADRPRAWLYLGASLASALAAAWL